MLYTEIALKTLGSIIVLFVLAKLIGNKQMTQITMFDYINSITIGSIAAEMAIADDENFMVPLLAMIIYGLTAVLITFITSKSLKMRRFFSGRSIVLMDDDKIFMKNLKKAKIELSEFLAQLRVNGYFDISEIHSVYLEPNGMVSILPKESYRNVTPKDIKLSPKQKKACTILILDGEVLYNNLKASSVDEKWLLGQIKLNGAKIWKDVSLASIDDEKNLTVFLQNNENIKNDWFQ